MAGTSGTLARFRNSSAKHVSGIDVSGEWDNWRVPVHLAASGMHWMAIVNVPYDTAVQYKFHVF